MQRINISKAKIPQTKEINKKLKQNENFTNQQRFA